MQDLTKRIAQEVKATAASNGGVSDESVWRPCQKVGQRAQRGGFINLRRELGWQRRMVEISLSGVSGGDQVYGLWCELRHPQCFERRGQQQLLAPTAPRWFSTQGVFCAPEVNARYTMVSF